MTFIGGHIRKSRTMLAGFLRLLHGFDLSEGNVHAMNSPPTHELEILGAQVGPFI
jgi:hypothetical protein